MFDSHRTKMIGYRAVKKLWRYVKPFQYSTGTWRTDGRRDRISMSISRVSIAAL